MLKKTNLALALSCALILVLLSSVAITAYAVDEQKAENASTLSPALQSMKNATPTGPALLPPKVVERAPVKTEPKHNPAGSQMLVAKLTIPVTCDGSIDATEWSDAYMYDVSDTTGQEDGIPDPLGTVTLWLKQDDNGVYFAIRNNADQHSMSTISVVSTSTIIMMDAGRSRLPMKVTTGWYTVQQVTLWHGAGGRTTTVAFHLTMCVLTITYCTPITGPQHVLASVSDLPGMSTTR